MSRLRPAVWLVVCLALVAGACGRGPDVVGTTGKQIKPLKLEFPESVLDLKVTDEHETIKEDIAKTDRSYIERIGVFSFRNQEELLQATLQVTRFNPGKRYTTGKFRRTVVNQIGGQIAQEMRVGDTTVFITKGTKQGINVWFRGSHMFVLSIRDDYDQPRSLLRAVMEVEP